MQVAETGSSQPPATGGIKPQIRKQDYLMDELVIRSERQYSLRFHSKRHYNDGQIVSYVVDLKARDFTASFEAGNHPKGTSPCAFFEEIAQDWSGWAGAKRWAPLDGEFELSASMDSTGHLTLIVQRDAACDAPGWSTTFSLMIEAGQLGALATDVKKFFCAASSVIKEINPNS